MPYGNMLGRVWHGLDGYGMALYYPSWSYLGHATLGTPSRAWHGCTQVGTGMAPE